MLRPSASTDAEHHGGKAPSAPDIPGAKCEVVRGDAGRRIDSEGEGEERARVRVTLAKGSRE